MHRELRQSLTVNAPVPYVWALWTTDEGVRLFFAPDSKIELKPRGAYELYFMEGEPGTRGSEGCTIVDIDSQRSLSFTWNFPPTLPTIRHRHTLVTVSFRPTRNGGTHLAVVQTGWEKGEEWEKGLAYFERAWSIVLHRLAWSIEKGPMDWDNPPAP